MLRKLLTSSVRRCPGHVCTRSVLSRTRHFSSSGERIDSGTPNRGMIPSPERADALVKQHASSWTNPIEPQIFIEGNNNEGFTIGDAFYRGSILITPTYCMLWDVTAAEHINMDTLDIVFNISPPPDIIVIGTGKETKRLPHQLLKEFHNRGIGVELCETESAVTVFNVLNQEGRYVFGAILSPEPQYRRTVAGDPLGPELHTAIEEGEQVFNKRESPPPEPKERDY